MYMVNEAEDIQMKELSGRTALITGAGGGIGTAVARRLAGLGMNLALCGRREDRLRATAALTGRPEDMLVISADLMDEAQAKECVMQTCARFGGLDVLVNNAGLALNCPLEETSTADFDRLMAVNVRAPFLLCREALPALKRSDRATIVNIGSVVAHVGYADQAAYTASKHALLGLTRALAKEVWRDGVRVHMVSPGGVDTDMIRIARPDLSGEGMIQADEVAEMVEVLVRMRGNAVVDEIRLHRAGKEPFQ